MADRNFINNTSVNETNSFVNLLDHMNPSNEDEINVIEHSIYYDNETFRNTIAKVNGPLRVLNLNCGGLSAKLDKLKIFLATCNDINRPISVITLQETHMNSSMDSDIFILSDYTLISDPARINNFGGVAIYVHNSFSTNRLQIEDLKQNS